MSDIISVQDLNLWYGNHQALHHINMEIPEKSITAFIGPSGCGKSTLLKTLNRMNDLVKGVRITGSVCYLGQDIHAPGVEVSELRRQIGMVFQKPNPFPMSIYDNVAYGPKTHGIRKKAELDEDRGALAAGCRHMGRGKRPPAEECPGTFRRSAAAAVHCAGAVGGTECAADGLADQCAGSHFHLQDRGAGDGAEGEVHHRYRDP